MNIRYLFRYEKGNLRGTNRSFKNVNQKEKKANYKLMD